MNWKILADSKLVENLGWTLVHSVWQIALLAFLLFAARRILSASSADARYAFAAGALAFSFILPAVTFVKLSQNSFQNRTESKNSPAQNQKRIKNNQPPEEILPPVKNDSSPSANAPREFISFENFQAKLRENFAVLVALWFFGVCAFSARLLGGVWQLRCYRRREIFEPCEEWQNKFSGLCERLKIKQAVKFFESNLVETPVVVGWLKPFVLVPASAFLQINSRELEMILAHELIHVRRSDNFVALAQSFIEILFFYHPCVWWISRIVRREREFAADATVTKIFVDSRIVYAEALANLEAIRIRKTTMPPVISAANGGNLMQRIQKILQKDTEIKRANSAWSAGLAFAFISAVLLVTFSANPPGDVNAATNAPAKKLAIGFVSIPPVDRSDNPPQDADATARLMIAKLAQHKIPAIGFVQGARISDGEKMFPVRAEIVRLWRDAGLEVGIGNFKHVWFYDTPYDDYVAGVEKNERITKQILAEKNLLLRYFSYPYLNTGKSVEDKTRFQAWLKSRGLTAVKYTVDNQEWQYSYAYDAARKDNDVNKLKQIRAEFLDYMAKMFTHYETYSQQMFGRDINQTMVLTTSRLVADSADDLFGMIERRGYKFVPMDEAQSDEAYNTPENFVGKSGISWFERWQMAQDKKLLDEPKVSEDVEKIWNEAKNKK